MILILSIFLGGMSTDQAIEMKKDPTAILIIKDKGSGTDQKSKYNFCDILQTKTATDYKNKKTGLQPVSIPGGGRLIQKSFGAKSF